ncbi:Serpentine Receptor, class Z [Caenorhabditis elegans]|uniref:Serpentine Receptor, class Z n=1 Tax=Caenorhabditis elegans TaxID=6239 RepID=Q7YWS1_CAEEL|nr:Serpentine Receptor, class Z [Caenorhabditis elegans]CAE17979.1 Serpentine Receptor, class Z [Caenorhabditis elegans]|eukprot:NP_001023405.1 Uncharacterized protein CELE_T27E7.9 [Caenorhabditis elegans]
MQIGFKITMDATFSFVLIYCLIKIDSDSKYGKLRVPDDVGCTFLHFFAHFCCTFLPEFAITNHAHYVIKNYFVKVMVGSVVFALFVLYLYFRFPHFYIFEFLLLIPLAIFVTTWSILAYISTIFAQVYQVLVVIFIFEQCWKMGKDEPEQTRNQIARKQFVTKDIIRTLYICCILRDFVLYPLIWYMSINSLFDLIFVSMNTEEVSVRAQLTYPRVFDLISTESIFFLVPISVLYYLYRRQNLTNKEHAKNPLQVYIFKQAMIMVAIKAIIIAIFSVMFLIDKNLSWFLTASRMDLILVVVAVQISAMICFRKRLIAYQQNPPQEIFMTRLPPIINEPPPDY